MPVPVLWGNQFVIDSEPNNQLRSIKVMALADGGFVGIWLEAGGGLRIQTFGADGVARNSEVRMPGETNSSYFDTFGITLLTDGGYVVSWSENVSGGSAVRGAVFNSDGTVRRSAFTLSKEAQNRSPHSSVVALDDGGFMMLHEKAVADPSDPNIYGRTFNAAGDLIRDDFIATGIVEGSQFNASSVRLANGNVAVLYSDSSPGSPSLTVARLRILKQDGTAASSPSDILVQTDYVNDPSIAALTDGRIVVVWTDPRGDIKARLFQQDGTPVGAELISVNSTTNGTQDISAVSALPGGGFAIAFEDWGPPTNRVYDIRVVTFNAAGERQSDDILAHGINTGAQAKPSISTLADGRFVVSWVDLESSSNLDKGNIVGQIFDARTAPVTVNGTNGADVYFGTEHDVDQLYGRAGNDALYGGAGHDLLIGGLGEDTLDGGSGGDWAVYTDAAAGVTADLTANTADLGRALNAGEALGDVYLSVENLRGSGHNDILIGNATENWLEGMAGEDTLFGSAGADTLDGGANYDQVSYQRSTAAILLDLTDADGSENKGDAKDDRFIGIDAYVGSTFNDTMTGGDKEDEFYGGADGDRLNGGLNRDYLFGEAGNDTLEGGAGNDVLNGGASLNTAVHAGVRSEYTVTRNGDGSITIRDLDGSEGTDTLRDVRQLQFSGGVTEFVNAAPTGLQLVGSSIQENAPNRAVVGTLSATDLDRDKLTYTLMPGSSSAFAIDPDSNKLVVNGPLDFETQPNHQVTIQASDGLGGTTSLTFNITVTDKTDETTPFTLWGTPGVDVLTGEAGNDTIFGSGSNDVLSGMAGNDKIHGGAGKDLLSGGAGKDVFVFDTRANKRTNVDKISDFRFQDDSLYLENRYFTKLGSGTGSKPKKFKADMFTTGTKAQDAEDRIVYDKKTGSLYYDQDGTGSKAQVKIATLTNKAKLYYHDFFVI